MIHATQVPPARGAVKPGIPEAWGRAVPSTLEPPRSAAPAPCPPRGPGRRLGRSSELPGEVPGAVPGTRLLALPALLALLLSACEGTTTVLPTPHFGQIGEIQVDVRSPLDTIGSLTESLVWRSEGPWTLVERVNYRGNQGSETVRYSRLNPGELTGEYASLIRQLNETPGLRLFGGALPQGLEPVCNPVLQPGSLPTTVTITIRDHFRGEAARWVRCARGTFFTITPGEAGPDPGAPRAVTAGQLVRFFTLGDGFGATYPGTVPYATLAQGEHSPARPEVSQVFVSTDGAPPADFLGFWSLHAGSGTPVPEVDWAREIVLLAAVGERAEAGDEVKVTRVVPIGGATRVEITERVPGDFCSPAARRIHPFHLVVTPAVPLPIEFTPPRVERIPCGI